MLNLKKCSLSFNLKIGLATLVVLLYFVEANGQRRGREKIENGKVVKGTHNLRCKEPEKTYTKNIETKVKGAMKGLSKVDAASLEGSLKTEVERLASYSQEGLDLDLILFRLCELTINRNISDEESSRLFSEATRNWNRKLSINEQKNIIDQLNVELESNLKTANELKRNSETFLNALNNVSGKGVLRNPGIQILYTFFPIENITDTATTVSELLDVSIRKYQELKLDTNKLEGQKFTEAARLIAATVEKTTPTINSLKDKDSRRYPVYSEIWKENIKNLKQIDVFDVTRFQQTYTNLHSLRSDYDIVADRISDYLNDLNKFFSPSDNKITKEGIAKILTSERLCFSLVQTYSKTLANNIENLSELRNVIKKSLE